MDIKGFRGSLPTLSIGIDEKNTYQTKIFVFFYYVCQGLFVLNLHKMRKNQKLAPLPPLNRAIAKSMFFELY